MFSQQPVLTKMPIYAWRSSDPFFNPQTNKLVYYAIDTWVDGQRYGNAIIVRDMETQKETVVDTKTINPALGWIDPSHLLIYRAYPISDSTQKRKLFRRDYGRKLYQLNILDQTKDYISSISLPATDSRIQVSGEFIVYEAGFSRETKVARLNKKTGLTIEYEQLRGLDIGYYNLAYRSSDDHLCFVEFDKGFGYTLHSLKNGILNTLVDSPYSIYSLVFDHYSNRIFYARRDYLGQESIYSFDFDKSEERQLYQLGAEHDCWDIEPYRKNMLILGLGVSAERRSIRQHKGGFVASAV